MHANTPYKGAATAAAVEPTQAHKSTCVSILNDLVINPIRRDHAGVRCIREMSQSLSSNVPDNSLEQEATTGHSIPRRLDSPTSQATQLPELELTLDPDQGRETLLRNNNHMFQYTNINNHLGPISEEK
ncbi:hypothetical protein Tco_1173729 [Tanacetum coccineum]